MSNSSPTIESKNFVREEDDNGEFEKEENDTKEFEQLTLREKRAPILDQERERNRGWTHPGSLSTCIVLQTSLKKGASYLCEREAKDTKSHTARIFRILPRKKARFDHLCQENQPTAEEIKQLRYQMKGTLIFCLLLKNTLVQSPFYQNQSSRMTHLVSSNPYQRIYNRKKNLLPILIDTLCGVFLCTMVGFDHENGEVCKDLLKTKDGTDHWLICSSSFERGYCVRQHRFVSELSTSTQLLHVSRCSGKLRSSGN
ncbi:unnamed protein product [Vicia faba]|uniref:Uncharacterized protein n=1 Tax=Vicia faba TaxID=3906 RepID=A0AAV0YQA0_VICFA|nr:unnamed protein product [Vicia faba]